MKSKPLCLCVMAFAAIQSNAASVAVNFAGGTTASNQKVLTSTQTVGAVTAQSNWNNVVPTATGPTTGGLANVTSPANGGLVDADGNATSVGLSYSTVYMWSWNGSTSYTGDDELSGFRQMYQGFIGDNTVGGSPLTLSLTNLNASFPQGYTVYVYLQGAGTGTLTDGTTSYSLAGGPGAIAGSVSYTLAGTGSAVAGANYAVFKELSGDSFDLTLQRTETGSSGNLGISGIQIVAIPEPSGALLGALGMLVLLRRKKA